MPYPPSISHLHAGFLPASPANSWLQATYFVSLALVTASLLMIALQDYRNRAVQWIWFPCLALGGSLLFLSQAHPPAQPLAPPLAQTVAQLLENAGYNLAFLAAQFLALKAYFFLRYRKRPSPQAQTILDDKIGRGDVAYLAAVCFCFSPLNFIVYYTGSLLFSMFAALGGRAIKRPFGKQIPLAGLQASLLILVFWTSRCLGYSLSNDDLLMTKFLLP
jgi:hypothetical protein